jgi:hypothetical protein
MEHDSAVWKLAEGLPGLPTVVSGAGRRAAASANTITDTFEPLGVRVYKFSLE